MSFPPGYWKIKPAEVRLQQGTLAEREAEAVRQGVFETWETKVRRDEEERRRKKERS